MMGERKLGIGAMMSYKTMRGLQTKWSRVFPAKENIAGIFLSDRQAFHVLQYIDYEDKAEFRSIKEALLYGGDDVDAIQLNMTWPDPNIVMNAIYQSSKVTLRKVKVLLEVGRDALDEADNDPKRAVRYIKSYGDVIDGVVFDNGTGTERSIDVPFIRPFVAEAYSALPELSVAVVEGLGSRSIGTVEHLVREFPDISINFQPRGDEPEQVDWDTAANYLAIAMHMVSRHERAPVKT
jgi:hypothetical protein